MEPAGTERYRVLVVDDSPVQRAAITLPLREAGYEVFEAATGRECIDLARASHPDVLLLDLGLPDGDGLDFLRRLRDVDDGSRPAIVIVSDQVNISDVASGLNAGAHDYLRKPVQTGELLARITAAGRSKRLHDDVTTRNAVLEQAVRTDHATGLPNRLHLEEHVVAACAMATRHGTPLGVLAIDIDHFKSINDGGGHARGDVVLAQVAGVLQRGLRQEDMAGRWGGDEFLVLLIGTSATHVETPAARILEDVRSLPRVEGLPKATVSIGAAVYQPGESSDRLLRRADAALYAAKASGRDTVVVAAPGPAE